jgi:hypothetical protein
MKLQAQLGQHDVGQLSIEHLDANSASAISLAPNQFGFSYNQVRHLTLQPRYFLLHSLHTLHTAVVYCYLLRHAQTAGALGLCSVSVHE